MADRLEDPREAGQVADRKAAVRKTDQFGAGTAGQTIAGAAYRNFEASADSGKPSPADPGFPVTRVGLYPGQGTGAEYPTYEQAHDLSDQTVNDGARLPAIKELPIGTGGAAPSLASLTNHADGETQQTRKQS